MAVFRIWALPLKNCGTRVETPAVSPVSSVSGLIEAKKAALQAHRVKATADSAWVRLVAVAVFLLLSLGFTFGGIEAWGVYVAPLGWYALMATVLFFARHSAWAVRLDPFMWSVDVALVFAVQSRLMSWSQFPAGVAGFSLGLFGLLVTLSASSLGARATSLTTLSASVAQVLLMRAAGVKIDAQVAGVVTLVLVALANQRLVARTTRIVLSLIDSEVERRLEANRFEALEAAKLTIEKMLGMEAEQNKSLRALQADKELLTQLLVHDLRSPLGAVLSNLQWLSGELKAHEDLEVRSAIEESRTMTNRLAAMIGDLLHLGKLEEKSLTLVPEPVEVTQLLSQIQVQMAAQARARHIHVQLVAEPGLTLDVDRALLTRVFENLASNALRYTPTHGRVQLEAVEGDSEMMFIISNDGEPIAPNWREPIFEKFAQVGSEGAKRSGGFGLGLYFCRLAIDAHTGHIAVEDRPGWATSFVVRMPKKARSNTLAVA